MAQYRMVSIAVAVGLTLVAASAVRADTLGPWYGYIWVRSQVRYYPPYGAASNAAGPKIDAQETCDVDYASSDGHVWSAHLKYSAHYTRKETVAGITTIYTETVVGTRDSLLSLNMTSSPYPKRYGNGIVITYNRYVVDMVAQTTSQATNSPLIRSVRHVSVTCNDISPFYATYPFDIAASANAPHRQVLLDEKTEELLFRGGLYDREFGNVTSHLTLFRNYPR